jgi:phenylacetyl-CoA:acceptor oxidoreductase 27-kDa subunit
MTRWTMVIDLRKCIGCGSCVEICSQVNNLCHGSEWRRLIEKSSKEAGHLKRLFLTMSCMHCENPPCLEVCPTKATHQTGDGIVDIDQKLCIGCAACILACPYHARSINRTSRMNCYDRIDDLEGKIKFHDRIGICSKCNFCRSVIETGMKKGLQPGRDPEATPICVQHCLGEALIFGDRDDPDSPVSQALNQNKTIRILEELDTNPAVYYIPDDKFKCECHDQ